jgi:hypothetical protein
MAGEFQQDADYPRKGHTYGSYAHESHGEQPAQAEQRPEPSTVASGGGGHLTLARLLLRNPHISGRGNAPVRQAALLSLQQTYGNRAVQRMVKLAVQRSTESDEEKEEEKGETAEKAAEVREAAARTSDAAREGSSAIVESSSAQQTVDATERAMIESRTSADPWEMFKHLDAHENAIDKLEGTTKSKVAHGLEEHLGSESRIGKGLNAANYGLQLWEGLAQGQGLGEAGFGALAGGYVNNLMPEYLFKHSPGVGWADTAANLVNAGLNLIPGMPEEVTGVTQTVADATPSSFATNVASTYGRGIWNTGKGIVTGDWSSLKQQRQDIMHGKAGAPLQGYALAGELLKWDRDKFDDITDEMREGKWGTVPKLSLKVKDALVGGPSMFELATERAQEMTEKEGAGRRALLDRNRAEIMKRYGDKGFLLMWRGILPIPDEVRQIDEQRSKTQM